MATEKNFQSTDPAAPADARNVIWQVDPTAAGTDASTGQPYFDTSAYMPDMVGDTGSGGSDGLVPAPPSGSAAAQKFLKADGTWAVPAGGGGSGFVQETLAGTLNGINKIFTSTFAPNPPASAIAYLNGVEQDQTRWITLSGSTWTFTVAPKATDFIRAIYTH